MERRRVRMTAERIETIGILTRIEQQADDFDPAVLSRQCQRQMSIFRRGVWQHSANIVDPSERGGNGQIETSTVSKQRDNRAESAMQCSSTQGAVWIGTARD